MARVNSDQLAKNPTHAVCWYAPSLLQEREDHCLSNSWFSREHITWPMSLSGIPAECCVFRKVYSTVLCVKLYLLTTALSVSTTLDSLLHTYLKHSTMVTTYGCLVHRWYTFDGWKYWSILCVMMPFLKPKGYAVKYSDTNNGVKVKAAYLILPTRLITSKCATQPWEIALAAQYNKSMLSTYFWGCTAQLMPFPVNNLYALSFASTSSLCSKR